MRLEDLTPDHIRKAVALYVERAWADVTGEVTSMRFNLTRLEGKDTLDELFEAFTLVQTGKVTSFPVVLFGTGAVAVSVLADAHMALWQVAVVWAMLRISSLPNRSR